MRPRGWIEAVRGEGVTSGDGSNQLCAVDGFPTRIALTFFRQFKGGAQYKHKIVLATEDVRTVPDRAVPACARPAHYREQRPVILAPGVVAR